MFWNNHLCIYNFHITVVNEDKLGLKLEHVWNRDCVFPLFAVHETTIS